MYILLSFPLTNVLENMGGLFRDHSQPTVDPWGCLFGLCQAHQLGHLAFGVSIKGETPEGKGGTAKEEPPWSWPLVFVTVFIAQRPARRGPSVNISLAESDNQALIPQRVRGARGKVAEGHGAPWSAVGRPLEGNGSLSSPQGKAVISVTPCLETDNVQPGSKSPFWPWGCPWKAWWAPERLGRGPTGPWLAHPPPPSAQAVCCSRLLTRESGRNTPRGDWEPPSICVLGALFTSLEPGPPRGAQSFLSCWAPLKLGTPYHARQPQPSRTKAAWPGHSSAEARGRAGAQRRRSEGFGRWVELAPYGPWMRDPGVLPKLQSLRDSQNLPFRASNGNIN